MARHVANVVFIKSLTTFGYFEGQVVHDPNDGLHRALYST